MGRGGRVAVAVSLALALAGCAGGPPAPLHNLPEGVSVSLVQLRSDVAARQVQVQIVNGSDAALTVSTVEISDGRFAGVAQRVADRASVIPAGATTGIRMQLPPVACPAPEHADPLVAIAFTVDGEPGETALPLPDPLGVIAPLHERECRAAALAAAAAVSFTAFTPSPPGDPADLELTVAPTGDAAAALTGIRTTNLLTFGQAAGATADVWPLDAKVAVGDSAPVVLHLPLVPLRCDPHAVQEDKRGTIFTVEVRIDGAQGEIELPAGEELRGRILTWVAEWCGFGG